jgi:hypothetical protein
MRRMVLSLILIAGSAGTSPAQADSSGINLKFNSDEATAVLAILKKEANQQTIAGSDWQNLFSTEPYVRLKKREAAMHRDFTDEDFKKFVLSPELLAKKDALRHTLEEWQKADLQASGQRVLAYLPDQAKIRAKVYPVIKPKENSFVFETETDPAIFLYLDPAESAAKFENTVAHELHHIGFSSVSSLRDEREKDVPANAKGAVEWMGAFGEGFAMLAAAGGPDVHPHAVSKPEERSEWDHDMANFNQDLLSLQGFFLDMIDQKFKNKDEADAKGFTFFGKQGPWYTVGYKMAVTVEKRYGRAVVIDCMIAPRELLLRYNSAAAEVNRNHGEQLLLWSPDLLAKIEPAR